VYDYATTAPLDEIRFILETRDYNMKAAREALKGNYGHNLGKSIDRPLAKGILGDSIYSRIIARTAAACDARMGGAMIPVMSNSGSGNQGMTTSLPVIVYAEGLGASKEKLYRALLISNLITLHAKTGIGRLSAYCGAVSAGAGAGAGIAFLNGGDVSDISHTIVNALAITSGIVCDGAKSSCAAKIATAVETGIFGYEMFREGQQFYGGDGLVAKGVENSIANFGRLAREGMRETDQEIILMMTEEKEE